MYISNLKLKNWKNFLDVDVDLKPFSVLVGANAAGKSNFADAILFLRDVVKDGGGLQYAAYLVRGGLTKIRALSARKNPQPFISITLSDFESHDKIWTYELALTGSGGGVTDYYVEVFTEKAYHHPTSTTYIDNTNESLKKKDRELLRDTFLQQRIVNQDYRAIFDFFREVNYLHAVPHLLRGRQAVVSQAGDDDYYGLELFEKIGRKNNSTRTKYLGLIEDFLKSAVPQLNELRFEKDPQGSPHLTVRFDDWRRHGTKQNETQFSDGTLRIISILWALMESGETLIIEEPELYLHSGIVKELPTVIKKAQVTGKMRQVIVTTHSYDFLNNEVIEPEEVVLLQPSRNGTECVTGATDEQVQNLLDSGFSIAEAVTQRTDPKIKGAAI